MTAIPISAGDYLRKKVWKGNNQQSNDKLGEIIDRFAKMHNEEQVNKIKLERYRAKGDRANGKYGYAI